MAERISRPPINIRGGLPDGNHNGSGDVAAHFLQSNKPGDRLAVIRVTLSTEQIDHEHGGARQAVLRIRDIEFPTDQELLARLLDEHRAERTGAGMLPFDDQLEPDRESAAGQATFLTHRIEVWAQENGVDARQKWVEYYGPENAIPGPRGASLIRLKEFVGYFRIATEITASLPDDDQLPPAVFSDG